MGGIATGDAGVPAHAVDDVDDVAELCRQLDGLRLVIELAAAWLPAVGLTGLRERSDLRLGAGPADDSADRHATLHSTIAWFYQLLGEDARRLFRHLAVVSDGFDLDVVEVRERATFARRGAPRRHPGGLLAAGRRQ